jgi:very-short-patch-repair endonuclease
MKKSNNIEFIEKSKEIHKDKYDYSLVDYKNANSTVNIICKIHGEFIQKPYNHTKGQGCPKCSGKLKLTKDEFIEKSKEIHKDKYDYSLVDYKNINSKVKIICKEHGEFNQNAGSHIYNKCNCPRCTKNIKSNTINFIKKSKEIHSNKYDYSSVEYINNHTKVTITCFTHGIFNQTPNHHIFGEGCPICSDNKRLNTDEFIKRAQKTHDNTFNYSLVDYVDNKTKIKIICKEHGIFEKTPSNHTSKKQGCPLCKIKSKGENEITHILNILNIDFQSQKRFNDCKNILTLPFDFYLPKYNLLIEFDGRQHFNINTIFYTPKIKENDKIKTDFCEKYNFNLLRIKYNENIKEKIMKIYEQF